MNEDQKKHLEFLRTKLIKIQKKRTSVFETSKEESDAMSEYLSFYSEIHNRELAMKAIDSLGLHCHVGVKNSKHKISNTDKKKQFGNRLSGLIVLDGATLSFGDQKIEFESEEIAKYLLDGLMKKDKSCLKLV